MSLLDSLRNILDGTTPEERAQDEDTRRHLKATLTGLLADAEEKLREWDYQQDPKNHVFPEHIDRGPGIDARREELASTVEHYRDELRHLG